MGGSRFLQLAHWVFVPRILIQLSMFSNNSSVTSLLLFKCVLKCSTIMGFNVLVFDNRAPSEGAEGVGRATTEAVVSASICILVPNFFVTLILNKLLIYQE